MQLLVNGKKYSVRFETKLRDDKYDRVEEPLIDTYCSISIINNNMKDDRKYELISSGSANLSHEDVDIYDKWVGRNLSFQRAIQSFNKGIRTEFWKEYRNKISERHFLSKIEKSNFNIRSIIFV